MKNYLKQLYYFPVTAMIFAISSHAMAVANLVLTINGYASIAGGESIAALLHISRSEDKADRMKQPGYTCCSLGVLAMEFEFAPGTSVQHQNAADSTENSGDVVLGGFHFSDFEGPDPLTRARKLLTISNEGGTATKKITARTNSWMGVSKSFGNRAEEYAVWHFALLQQQDALMFLRSFVQHQSKNIAITITDSQNPAIQLQANFAPTATEIAQMEKIMRSGLPKN